MLCILWETQAIPNECKVCCTGVASVDITRVKLPVFHKVRTILCPTTADGDAAPERVEMTKL